MGTGEVWPATAQADHCLLPLISSRRKKIRSPSPPNGNEKVPLPWVLTVTEAWCSRPPQPERCKDIPFLAPSLGGGSSCFLWPSLRNFPAAPPFFLSGPPALFIPLHCCSIGRFSQQPEAAKPDPGGSP